MNENESKRYETEIEYKKKDIEDLAKILEEMKLEKKERNMKVVEMKGKEARKVFNFVSRLI